MASFLLFFFFELSRRASVTEQYPTHEIIFKWLIYN